MMMKWPRGSCGFELAIQEDQDTGGRRRVRAVAWRAHGLRRAGARGGGDSASSSPPWRARLPS